MTIIIAVLVLTSWAGAVGCVVAYARWYEWRSSRMGRHVMSFMAGLAVLLSLAVLGVFWPDLPARPGIRAGAYLLVNVMVFWRLTMLLRSRR